MAAAVYERARRRGHAPWPPPVVARPPASRPPTRRRTPDGTRRTLAVERDGRAARRPARAASRASRSSARSPRSRAELRGMAGGGRGGARPGARRARRADRAPRARLLARPARRDPRRPRRARDADGARRRVDRPARPSCCRALSRAALPARATSIDPRRQPRRPARRSSPGVLGRRAPGRCSTASRPGASTPTAGRRGRVLIVGDSSTGERDRSAARGSTELFRAPGAERAAPAARCCRRGARRATTGRPARHSASPSPRAIRRERALRRRSASTRVLIRSASCSALRPVWSARATIAAPSTPAGSVPNTRPRASPSRPAQNASADRGRREAHEQRGLEGEREVLDRAAREPLGVLAGRARRACGERVEVGVEPRVAAAGQLALGQERGQALGLARQRAQHVERASRCPSPPRSRSAARRAAAAASATPRRSRCRPGTRAPRRRAASRACRSST